VTDLTEIDGHLVISEDYYRIADLPIMVCVLTLAGEFYVTGISASKRRLFDEDVARAFSKRNAKSNASRALAKLRPTARAAAE
jgi:hypothetical protein